VQIDKELSNLEPTSNKKSKESPKQQVIGILLEVKESSQIKLLFSYLVYNAGWTPKYDLRVTGASKAMQVSYFGMIQQNTGEDWYVTTVCEGDCTTVDWIRFVLFCVLLKFLLYMGRLPLVCREREKCF